MITKWKAYTSGKFKKHKTKVTNEYEDLNTNANYFPYIKGKQRTYITTTTNTNKSFPETQR